MVINMDVQDNGNIPVSYTHLDVYKRQPMNPTFVFICYNLHVRNINIHANSGILTL